MWTYARAGDVFFYLVPFIPYGKFIVFSFIFTSRKIYILVRKIIAHPVRSSRTFWYTFCLCALNGVGRTQYRRKQYRWVQMYQGGSRGPIPENVKVGSCDFLYSGAYLGWPAGDSFRFIAFCFFWLEVVTSCHDLCYRAPSPLGSVRFIQRNSIQNPSFSLCARGA